MNELERSRLLDAIAAFNRRSEEYFELYDSDVVLHGYPAGVDGLRAAKAFYRAAWERYPDGAIDVRAIEDVAEGTLRVRFEYAGRDGVTTLRFRDGRVVERWQGS